MKEKGLPLEDPTVQGVATALLALHNVAPNEARNAYSGCLLLPGFQSLRFNALLGPMKKGWGASAPKYATFWDASPILEHLAAGDCPLDLMPLETLRSSLILCCRLLCLHRGIDLARTQRTIAFEGERPFIWLRRKGWTKPRWEELLRLNRFVLISPWHLVRTYVQRTMSMGAPGGPLILSLKPPYKALTADAINSVTKRFLSSLGIDMTHWGAHSTRGAGVKFYKSKGLLADEVCEIGQWKNLQAFTQHYLRVGAAQRAAQVVDFKVHNASPHRSAEHEGSLTPPKNEGGGGDPECEAQRGGEPSLPPQSKRKLSGNGPQGSCKRSRKVNESFHPPLSLYCFGSPPVRQLRQPAVRSTIPNHELSL